MRKSSITKLLSRLGLDPFSTKYNLVRKDISVFLKESVNIHMASEDELRSAADRYLTNATNGTAAGYWTLDANLRYCWPVEEHRPKMKDIIWQVMICMQGYAIDVLHRAPPCSGCRVHTQPQHVNGTVLSTDTSPPQCFSSQENPLPQVRSDVEGAGARLRPRNRLSSWDTITPPLSLGEDDPNDSDYRDSHRPRKRPRTTTTSSILQYTPPVIARNEKEVADVKDIISLRSSVPSPGPSFISQQPASHAMKVSSSITVPTLGTNPSGLNASPLSGADSLDPNSPTTSNMKRSPFENTRLASSTNPPYPDPRLTSSLPPPTSDASVSHAPTVSSRNPPSLTAPTPSSMRPPYLVAPPPPSLSPVYSAPSHTPTSLQPVEMRTRKWTFLTAEKQAKALIAARACQFNILEMLVQDATDQQLARLLVAVIGQRDDVIQSVLETAGAEEQAKVLAVAFKLEIEKVEALSEMLCGDDRLLHRKRMTQLDRRIEDCFIENDGW